MVINRFQMCHFGLMNIARHITGVIYGCTTPLLLSMTIPGSMLCFELMGSVSSEKKLWIFAYTTAVCRCLTSLAIANTSDLTLNVQCFLVKVMSNCLNASVISTNYYISLASISENGCEKSDVSSWL